MEKTIVMPNGMVEIKEVVLPKCPNCKEELDQLDNVVSGQQVYKMWVDSKGEFAEYEGDDFYPDNGENRWECHNCQHTIANNEEDAIKFLKGA